MTRFASITTCCVALALSACTGMTPSSELASDNLPAGDWQAAAPVVAEDIAMNRAAQTDGVYAALAARASRDAVTFDPQPVEAARWLEAQGEQTLPTVWRPHAAFMSCDGRTGVTTGAIEWGDQAGYYTTVWQYFGRPGEGQWRWVLSHGDGLEVSRPAPAVPAVRTASCKGQPTVALTAPAQGVKMRRGLSGDQSLSYEYVVRPDGSRVVTVALWDGARHETVLRDVVVAR